MKKFLIHLSNIAHSEILDDFVAYAENESDDNLFMAIDNMYIDMYYLYNNNYQNTLNFIKDMTSVITEWNDGIENAVKDNLPVIYDARNK